MKTTKEEIIKNAVKLFNEEGYQNITVDKICATCNITKGSFYHHFNSKDDIMFSYWQYMNSDKSDLAAILMQDIPHKEKLWSILEIGINGAVIDMGRNAMGDFWRADLKQGNLILNPFAFSSGESYSVESNDILLNLIRKAQQNNEISSKCEPKDLLFVFYASLMGISVNWSNAENDYDVNSVLKKTFDIIFS